MAPLVMSMFIRVRRRRFAMVMMMVLIAAAAAAVMLLMTRVVFNLVAVTVTRFGVGRRRLVGAVALFRVAGRLVRTTAMRVGVLVAFGLSVVVGGPRSVVGGRV